MTSLIKVPFASSGDKTAVPDTDAGGSVNMTQGYGQSYSLDPATDPSAKRIEREKMNWLFNLITSALKEIQAGGVAPFITSSDNGGIPYSYGKGSTIILGGVVYQSLADSNTTTPPGTQWSEVKNSSNGLTRQNPFSDIKADGTVNTALSYLSLIGGIADAAVGRLVGIVDFTSSGTYTPSALAKFIIVIVTGGGGGGGGSLYTDSTHVSVGGGGGGGGTAVSKLKISDITATVAVTVGSAGIGGSSSAIATAGGASSFGSYLTGNGGGFGSAGTAIAVGSNAMTYNGGGSTSSNGNLDNQRGGSGGVGLVCQTNYESGAGGSSYWGAGGVPIAGQGSATAGDSGSRGSGGSGGLSVISTAVVMNGGNGGAGFVRVMEFA